MKLLWVFSGMAVLLLSSATPPPAAKPSLPDAACSPNCIPRLTAAPVLDAGPFGAEVLPVFTVAAAEPTPPPPAPQAPPPAPEPVPDAPVALAEAAAEEPEREDGDPEEAATDAKEPWRGRSGIRVVVSLPQQKAYVFKDGELLDTSPVSTGKRGHETPVGTFPILQKKVHHRSNRYDNAPMPYMQRLTWSGVALHAGSLPGYPASHGCIRLPRSCAKKLYGLTKHGTIVTVTRKKPKSAEDALALA